MLNKQPYDIISHEFSKAMLIMIKYVINNTITLEVRKNWNKKSNINDEMKWIELYEILDVVWWKIIQCEHSHVKIF